MSEHTAENDAIRRGVEAVIADRYRGDFAPILPKLRALLDATPCRNPYQNGTCNTAPDDEVLRVARDVTERRRGLMERLAKAEPPHA